MTAKEIFNSVKKLPDWQRRAKAISLRSANSEDLYNAVLRLAKQANKDIIKPKLEMETLIEELERRG